MVRRVNLCECRDGREHFIISSLASRNYFFCTYGAWLRQINAGGSKSMSDVVSGGLICGADPWDTQRTKRIELKVIERDERR